MRKGVAGAVLVLALALASGAHAAQERAFQKVAPTHWSYASVRLLESRGYYTGSPDGTFNGQRPLARYDFAVAVERIYKSVQQQVLASAESPELAGAVQELRRLLTEFEPDLADLGADVAEMRRQAASIDERLNRSQTAGPSLRIGSRPSAVTQALGRAFTPYRPQLPAAARPGYTIPLLSPGIAPGLVSGVGPASVGFSSQRPDSLTAPNRIPFARSSDVLGYQANLRLPLGAFALETYYNRDGFLHDPYGLANPFVNIGPAAGVGSRVSGPFFNERLRFLLEAAKLQALLREDPLEAFYFNAGLQYRFGGGLSLSLGYETIRAYNLGQIQNGQALSFGIAQPLTKSGDVSFGVLMKYFSPGNSLSGFSGRPDLSNSSAITQISVKF